MQAARPIRGTFVPEEGIVISNVLRTPALYVSGAVLAALLLLFNFGKDSSATPSRYAAGDRPRPVVVELFTSEGCSSCPPADALLKELSEQQPLQGVQVIALEEHVDYWNHLGWTDPFSSTEFSQRQSDYARVFGNDGVYTPQMVVDGQSEFVGSRGGSAKEAIQKAARLPKFEIALHPAADAKSGKPALELQIQNPDNVSVHGALELWVAVTEKSLQSEVKAGENSGETLKHAAVVRSLRKFDTLDDAAYQKHIELSLDPRWKKANLAIVAFLTEQKTQKIVGVATTSLN